MPMVRAQEPCPCGTPLPYHLVQMGETGPHTHVCGRLFQIEGGGFVLVAERDEPMLTMPTISLPPPQKPKKAHPTEGNLRVQLAHLTASVGLALAQIEALLKHPASKERDEELALVVSELDLANKIARRFGLGMSLKKLKLKPVKISGITPANAKQVRAALNGSRDEIPEAWTKVLAEAEGMTPEREWANLTTKERSSVMAYLADDAEEYAEHRQTNLVVLSLLLILENRRLKESRW